MPTRCSSQSPRPSSPIAIASLSDNIPDGWRTVGPLRGELAGLDAADRRVLVVGRLSIGLYAAAFAAALGAHVDYVDTDAQRLAAAEKLGAAVHDRDKPDKSWDPLSGHRAHVRRSVAAGRDAARDLAGRRVYRYRDLLRPKVEMPLLADVHPRRAGSSPGGSTRVRPSRTVLELLAGGCDLSPAVDRVVAWEDAPSAWPTMTGKTVFTRA